MAATDGPLLFAVTFVAVTFVAVTVARKRNTHHSLFVFFFGDKRTGWHTVLPFCCKIVCSNAVTNTKPMSAAVAVPFWRHMLRNRMKLVVRVHCLLFLFCLLLCLFFQNQYSSEDTLSTFWKNVKHSSNTFSTNILPLRIFLAVSI